MWRIAAPMILSNISIPLVGITDTVITGHLENPEYLASIAVATTFIGFFVASMNFLRMGTTGIVSQNLGSKDFEEVFLSLVRPLLIAFSIGCILFISKELLYDLSIYFLTPSNELKSFYKALRHTHHLI